MFLLGQGLRVAEFRITSALRKALSELTYISLYKKSCFSHIKNVGLTSYLNYWEAAIRRIEV
jgi:hypothetical protein